MLVGGTGPQSQDGRAVGDQAGCGVPVGIAHPEARIGGWVEVEDTTDFLDPVELLTASALDTADLSRQYQVSMTRSQRVRTVISHRSSQWR